MSRLSEFIRSLGGQPSALVESVAVIALTRYAGLSVAQARSIVAVIRQIVSSLEGVDHMSGREKQAVVVDVLDRLLDRLFGRDVPKFVAELIVQAVLVIVRWRGQDDDEEPVEEDETGNEPVEGSGEFIASGTDATNLAPAYGVWFDLPLPDSERLQTTFGFQPEDCVYRDSTDSKWSVRKSDEPKPLGAVLWKPVAG